MAECEVGREKSLIRLGVPPKMVGKED